MNCFKSINLIRDYGKLRLWFISSLFSLTYFIVYFMSFSMYQPETHYIQTGMIPVLLAALIVLPMHVILHCVPIWVSGKRASVSFGDNRLTFYCRIPGVISRRVALTSISMPLFLITAAALIGPLFLPQFLHLFAIVSTLNIFLSLKDMIYIQHLWNSPKDSYLEDGDSGFQIIVRRTV
ncbi:DUF3267 domain-containing protein [Alkalihalobacillus sp. AL-G]|uniref:DUF3267 domain-containing protein n=1 Tax=Alkalihalobacillus sp. AL-G TaxID=2926399 RepID=UPI00272B6677|nr:DUF3267 domain-containing protein [Alkalihalobacillus sp. AL-G]WLD94074.1 DUF3267 domain-containing protein [Alkalihalobacillus sp. AL-G]